MNYAQALTKLISSTHRIDVKNHKAVMAQMVPGSDALKIPAPTRDQVATSDRQIHLAAELFNEFTVMFDELGVEFDTARPNSREYGITVAVGGWTFFAYRNRITLGITIEAMPTRYVKRGYANVDNAWAFGSHGRMQMPGIFGDEGYNAARDALVAMVKLAYENDNVSREALAKAAANA